MKVAANNKLLPESCIKLQKSMRKLQQIISCYVKLHQATSGYMKVAANYKLQREVTAG